MFRQEEFNSLNPKYFNIILLDPYDMTVQSKNTGHYWILRSTGMTGKNACMVYYKHKYQHPYHQHGHGNSLRQAIRSIKSHDWWQMNWRKH